MESRRLVVICVVGAALIASAFLAGRRLGRPESLLEEGEQLETGRWHLAYTPELLGSARERQRARVMSSPYLAGSRTAEIHSGVIVHDASRTQPGWNFYVSGHAAEAYLLSNEGRVVARWAYPLESVFPAAAPAFDYWRRAQLLPDGGLVAMYQGVGLVKIDVRSQLEWAVEAPVFNDLEVTGDGTIYTLTKRPTVSSSIHPSNEILEDAVTVLGPSGKILRSVSLLAALETSEYAALLRPISEAGDVFHSNTVTRLTSERHLPFTAGHLLVSVREIDLIATLDLGQGRLDWAQRGPWSKQHEPVLLASGRILLFDNRGAPDGGSRALEFDPISGDVTWEYRGLNSREAGSVQRLANGNTLICESERGRALEVTADGETVWEFLSPHRAGRDNELVATLFEVVRLPTDCCADWLSPTE